MTSQRDLAARTNDRCPSCSAPMVGTKPSVFAAARNLAACRLHPGDGLDSFQGCECGDGLAGGGVAGVASSGSVGWRRRLRQRPAPQDPIQHGLAPRQILRRTFQSHGIDFVVGPFDEHQLFDPIVRSRFLAILNFQHLRRLVVHSTLLPLQSFETLPTLAQPAGSLLDDAVEANAFLIALGRRHNHAPP